MAAGHSNELAKLGQQYRKFATAAIMPIELQHRMNALATIAGPRFEWMEQLQAGLKQFETNNFSKFAEIGKLNTDLAKGLELAARPAGLTAFANSLAALQAPSAALKFAIEPLTFPTPSLTTAFVEALSRVEIPDVVDPLTDEELGRLEELEESLAEVVQHPDIREVVERLGELDEDEFVIEDDELADLLRPPIAPGGTESAQKAQRETNVEARRLLLISTLLIGPLLAAYAPALLGSAADLLALVLAVQYVKLPGDE